MQCLKGGFSLFVCLFLQVKHIMFNIFSAVKLAEFVFDCRKD